MSKDILSTNVSEKDVLSKAVLSKDVLSKRRFVQEHFVHTRFVHGRFVHGRFRHRRFVQARFVQECFVLLSMHLPPSTLILYRMIFGENRSISKLRRAYANFITSPDTHTPLTPHCIGKKEKEILTKIQHQKGGQIKLNPTEVGGNKSFVHRIDEKISFSHKTTTLLVSFSAHHDYTLRTEPGFPGHPLYLHLFATLHVFV